MGANRQRKGSEEVAATSLWGLRLPQGGASGARRARRNDERLREGGRGPGRQLRAAQAGSGRAAHASARCAFDRRCRYSCVDARLR